jgi:hypothetical protein
MAKGIEMMFDALKRMIPQDVWDLVVKNVTGINANVETVKNDIAEIRRQNEAIMKQLGVDTTEFTLRVIEPTNPEHRNGEASHPQS